MVFEFREKKIWCQACPINLLCRWLTKNQRVYDCTTPAAVAVWSPWTVPYESSNSALCTPSALPALSCGVRPSRSSRIGGLNRKRGSGFAHFARRKLKICAARANSTVRAAHPTIFLHGLDGHLDFEGLLAAAVDHAAQRRHVREVAAPSEGDVLQRWHNVVGRVEVDPSVARDE